ncbi:hypothetical protein, partial [Acinetobacter baumannii]|uniref:hypothetical protein n=1 Tax=Acinetobacter baumannii TaxID=470 RepID=UPI003916E736
MTLARRMAKSKSNRFFVDENCHPQTLSVVQTRAEAFGFELVVGTLDDLAGHEVFGALLQYPDTHGEDSRPASGHRAAARPAGAGLRGGRPAQPAVADPAAAEAMTLARRMAKSKSNRFFVDENCHPQTLS